MTEPLAYMICTTPRSGSTLLCRMLTATGVAGQPASLFYRPDMADWEERLKIRPERAASETARLQAILQAARLRGRGNTPVFGLRQQWPSFEFLCRCLARHQPGSPGDRAHLERAFGPLRFIHLRRADKQAQAVSYLRARQSGLWHVGADGAELERTAPAQPAVYDAAALRHWADQLAAYDDGWEQWFAQQQITPIRLTYEALALAPIAELRRALAQLGLNGDAAERVVVDTRKMADATSRDWLERLRREDRCG